MKEIAEAIASVSATMTPAARATPTPAPIAVRAVPRPKLPSILVAPITGSIPPSMPSRATPVTASPIRRSNAVWIVGVLLTLLGVAALAAAIGIVFGSRTAPAVAIAPIAPVISAPAAAPVAIEVAPAPVVASTPPPETVVVAPPPTHRAHAQHAALAPAAIAEPVAPPITTDEPAHGHSAIRVLDPWDDP
jgi:hypothetical protein